ncbi:GNAT family N-acetyltransferase [Sphingomicrobium astaxanthinifaciens]|nr:GNAT family N-acetyltransferase [Sphingomicrobium astaxanthinifaciens]MCJ7422363.1 GNAT family N-acetyltransferase [Sphingomicrobium astaxanthinifaciens]
MNACFDAAFGEDSDYRQAPPGDAYLRARLADRSILLLVAETPAAEVVGALTAYVLDKCEQERAEIFIYDLAVAARWRRRGIATALIERTRAIARALGAWTVFLGADRGDTAPIALYSKLGRRQDVHHFDIAP